MVSLRECFLYFLRLANIEHTAVNSMSNDAWVGGSDFKLDPYDCVSDGTSSDDGKASSRKKSSSGQQPQQQIQQSSSVAALECYTSDLTLGDRRRVSHRNIPLRQAPDVTVYYSDSRKRWYYEDRKGKRVFVELYEDYSPDGTPFQYYIEGGERQLVKFPRKGKGRAPR